MAREMFNMIREDLPARYELSVQKDSALTIRIHKQTMREIEQYLRKTAPIAEGLQEELEVPGFIEPSAERWGFGGRIAHAGTAGPWLSFDCPLPIIAKPLEGKQEGLRDIEWGEAYALSASLGMLFTALDLSESDTDCGCPQLLSVDGFVVMRRAHGGSLSVRIGRPLCRLIATYPDECRHERITGAMAAAYRSMFGRFEDHEMWQTHSRFCRPKFVHLSVPGDACGLDPEHGSYGREDDRGYKITPHNVDSPLQQLTLLVGLAAMHDLAREKGF